MRCLGLTLLELLAALAILAIVAAAALPIYSVYTDRAQRTAAQADLLRCAQGMERHANEAMSYALAVDADGDGTGDSSTGAVSANICTIDADDYDIVVHAADADGFALRAKFARGGGMLETDADGARRWDRNDDGDFDDEEEHSWLP